MFYCNKCAAKNKWPESIFKSEGLCEVCAKPAVCNDRPSRFLPIPEWDAQQEDLIAEIEYDYTEGNSFGVGERDVLDWMLENGWTINRPVGD